MHLNTLFTRLVLLCLAALCWVGCSQSTRSDKRILVFSKTSGWRHESIPAGKRALQQLGLEHGFAVDTTENAAYFTQDSLSRYSAVVFLSTTKEVLDYRQQAEFERYIQAGGGYVGIHAAADTEYDWPWYNKLVGGYFASHPNNPNVRRAVVEVVDKSHASTSHLPERWEREDEWYNYKQLNPDVTVLTKLDTKSYEGSTHKEDAGGHPIAWYHEYDGGRAFYTGGGHTDGSFAEPLFLQHLLGGIQYAIGDNRELDYGKATTAQAPEENRFLKVVLDENLTEPMELAVAGNGNVYFVERLGALKMYDAATRSVRKLAQLPVHTKFEDGLMGIALDPNFEANGYVYLYYSPVGNEPKNVLSRFRLAGGDSLLMASERVILEVPTQREQCCHTGGSLAFGPDGSLFLSTGDNSNPFNSEGYAPIDERPGRSPWDAQKSSANTNDLRGKILRIKVNPDGSYSIPKGNLFREAAQGRPEVYVMGNRNPYRIALDQKTGFLYWGEIGPDAGRDSIQGPRGHDEFNQARRPGFFGWPYFIGDNKPYNHFNFATNSEGEAFDPQRPLNNSPNNTGARALPLPQPAFIYYPYAESAEFPIVGKGGRSAMAGPVYHADHYRNSRAKFPGYYDGKWFIYDWMRNWIMAVSMDREGNLVNIEPFLPNLKLDRPMDMEFGPDGAMYILEYGTDWFAQNRDARLVRIEYAEGNRIPQAGLAADRTVGAAPLQVKFSGKNSFDYDPEDELTYQWFFTGPDQVQSTEAEPTFTFDKPGVYRPVLRVTDKQGESSTAEMEISVGNEPPKVELGIQGNRSFFWSGRTVTYEARVTDKEEGSLAKGGINPAAVNFSVGFVPQGKDLTQVAQGHQLPPAATAGLALIEGSDCKACHAEDRRVLGPSYREVAQRYKGDNGAVERLAQKVITGGSGNWGDREMSAHPQLSTQQAQEMVRYILSLGEERSGGARRPLQGTYVTNQHSGEGQEASYFFTLSYTDKGAGGIGPQASKDVVVLRYPRVQAEDFNTNSETVSRRKPSTVDYMFIRNINQGSWVSFRNLDLTEANQVTYRVSATEAGGTIEMRLGSPTGRVVSTATVPATGDDLKFVNVSAPVSSVTGGPQEVFLVFMNGGRTGAPTTNLFNVDWMQFGFPAAGGGSASR